MKRPRAFLGLTARRSFVITRDALMGVLVLTAILALATAVLRSPHRWQAIGFCAFTWTVVLPIVLVMFFVATKRRRRVVQRGFPVEPARPPDRPDTLSSTTYKERGG